MQDTNTHTFYDDAELAAIKATRLAISEEWDQPKSAEIGDVAADMFNRWGVVGITSLVLALARQHASAIEALSLEPDRNESADEILDSFEMFKLDQIVNPDHI